MFSFNKKTVFVLILTVILIAVFAVWKFGLIDKLRSASNLKQEPERFQKSLELLNTLDSKKRLETIPELEKIIKYPSSPGKKAHAQILLAGVYFDNDDTVFKAINLLKETALNEKYPSRWRAIAINNLAQVSNNYSEEFVEKYIFSDEPFQSFYNKEEGFHLATHRIYLWSDQIRPLDLPNYRISHWYAEELAMDKINPYLSSEKKTEYFSNLNQRLKTADKLFASTPVSVKDQDVLLLCYLIKARILGKLHLINPSSATKVEAEAYFKKAIEIDQKVFLPRKTGYAASFYYAAFLAEIYGDSKINEIKSILTPMYDPLINRRKQGFFSRFLTNEKNSTHDNHYHKREILLLARLDERFRSLLKELNWTEEQLNTKIAPLAD